MEYWFQKDINHFNFIIKPAGGGTINPTLNYPLRAAASTSQRAEPIIPRFHCSIIPIARPCPWILRFSKGGSRQVVSEAN